MNRLFDKAHKSERHALVQQANEETVRKDVSALQVASANDVASTMQQAHSRQTCASSPANEQVVRKPTRAIQDGGANEDQESRSDLSARSEKVHKTAKRMAEPFA